MRGRDTRAVAGDACLGNGRPRRAAMSQGGGTGWTVGRRSVEAQFAAQRIALAPLAFQAARWLREFGILAALQQAPAGLCREDVAQRTNVTPYGVAVLLEAGRAAGLVNASEKRYSLTEVGLCFLTDELTRVNLDIVQHCLYQALHYVGESIRDGTPVGLHQTFGSWETIYPALASLPEPARSSWHRW